MRIRRLFPLDTPICQFFAPSFFLDSPQNSPAKALSITAAIAGKRERAVFSKPPPPLPIDAISSLLRTRSRIRIHFLDYELYVYSRYLCQNVSSGGCKERKEQEFMLSMVLNLSQAREPSLFFDIHHCKIHRINLPACNFKQKESQNTSTCDLSCEGGRSVGP